MGSPEVKVFENFHRPVKKATGNPYPRRGQIGDMIFKDISQSIETILLSIYRTLFDDGEWRSPHHGPIQLSKEESERQSLSSAGLDQRQEDISRFSSDGSVSKDGWMDGDSKPGEIHPHPIPG